jgi:HMG (high mobility group) box
MEPLAVTIQGKTSADGVTSLARKRERSSKILRGPSRHEDKQKKVRKLPKRPISAYNLFFQRERYIAFEEERLIVGPSLGPEMLGKIMGRRWKNMSAEKREEYQKLSKVDHLRYRKEMAEYELIHGQRKHHSGTEIDKSEVKPFRDSVYKKGTRRLSSEKLSRCCSNEQTPAFVEFSCHEPECVDVTQLTRMISEEATVNSAAPHTYGSVGDESQYSSDSRSPNLSRQSSAHECEPSSPYVQHQAYTTDVVSGHKYHGSRPLPYAACYPPCVPTYGSVSPLPSLSSTPHSSHLLSSPLGGFPPQPSYSMPPPRPSWDCPARIPVRNGMFVQLPDPQTGVERFYKVQYKCYQMTRAEANAYMAACCDGDGGTMADESPSYSAPPTMSLERLLRTPLPPGCKEIKFPLCSSDGSLY